MYFSDVWWFLTTGIRSHFRDSHANAARRLCVWLGPLNEDFLLWWAGEPDSCGGTLASLPVMWGLFPLGCSLLRGGLLRYVPARGHSGRRRGVRRVTSPISFPSLRPRLCAVWVTLPSWFWHSVCGAGRGVCRWSPGCKKMRKGGGPPTAWAPNFQSGPRFSAPCLAFALPKNGISSRLPYDLLLLGPLSFVWKPICFPLSEVVEIACLLDFPLLLGLCLFNFSAIV